MTRDPRPVTEYALHCAIIDLLALKAHRDHAAGFEKLAKRIEVCASGCWEWRGPTNEKGYGFTHILHLKRNMYTHRFAALAFGMDIDGRLVCHHCDNPPCMNPDHLFVGTQTDNMQDCIKKGRYAKPPPINWPEIMKQRRHHWQKLSRYDIAPIRVRLDAGESQASIAADYGVSFQTISKIKTGTRWSHVL